MKHRDFSRLISGILVLALAVGLFPVTALAEEKHVEAAQEVLVGESDPMLGVQSGVAETTPRAPRSREELLALEGVTLTADGELASVNTELVGELTDEEWAALLGGGASAYAVREADPYEDLREQFGLTDAQVQRGIDLHGDLLGLTEELSDLWRQREYLVFSDAQWADLTELVTAGYTSSQAIWGYGARDVLGVDVEAMVTAKAAEIAADRAQAESPQEDEAPEPVSEFAALAGKLSLPVALVEERLEGTAPDEDAIWAAARQAVQDAYPSAQEEEDAPAVFAAGVGQFTPKEVLGRPYTYDQQGNFDVNVNTGAYSYTETDLSIPGKNGLDLVLTRQYHSDQARATRAYGYYELADKNRNAFRVDYRWYLVDTTQTPCKLTEELTDRARYKLNDQENAPKPPEQDRFRLGEMQEALEAKERMRLDSFYYATDTKYGDPITVVLVPDIFPIGTVYTSCFETYSLGDPYLVDRFGLGNGWMLGLSHFRWVSENYNGQGEPVLRPLLTTSEGEQYYIKEPIGSTENYIEDYDGDELIFRGCTPNEYSGAAYCLCHKDGRKEFFNEGGRNIAIVDRFGNTITIEHIFEPGSSRLSKIKITDTLGNIVEYTKATENTAGKADGIAYNGRWQLTLNNNVIRDYYTYSDKWQLLNRANVQVTQLVAVSNEAGEVTSYGGSIRMNLFNCMLQPKEREITGTDPEFANDSSDIVVTLENVLYPNSGLQSLEVSTDYIGAFGTGGYRHIPRCVTLEKLNSAKISSHHVEYQIGDYDGLEGIEALYGGQHISKIRYRQAVPIVDSDGDKTGDEGDMDLYDMKYSFNRVGQLKREEKTSHGAIPSWQESFLWQSSVSGQRPWISRKTEYTYEKPTSRRPQAVTTTYYDPDTSMTMTQKEAYTYDVFGNILTYQKPNGQTETYTYDTNNYSLPLTMTLWQDANTKLTTTNTLSADGKSIASTEITSQKSGEAAETVGKSTYTYDSSGQLTVQNDYKDAENYVTTTYAYAAGALPTQISVSGVKTADGFNAAGTPGFASGTVVRRQTYNARGWLTSQTDANGKTTTYTYDPVGRITKVTYPDGTAQSYSYDVKYSTVTYTDQAGSQWLCRYGQSGKLLSVKDLASDQLVEARTYDHWDHLLKRTVYGQSTPEQTTRYRYDTDGRVITQAALNANGGVTYREDYTYRNGSGRVSKVIPGDASMPEMEAITYQDNMGNIVKAGLFRNGREEWDTYAYDYLGNQTQARTAYSASQGCAYTTATTYDHAGRVLSTADAAGNTVTYTYDWLGNRLTQRSPKDQNTDPTKTKYPTVYTYDALSRLIRVETPLAAGHTGRTDYTYDPNGNVTRERTLTGAKGDTASARSAYYTYDALGRVTQVKGDAKPEGQSGTSEYQYTNYTYDVLGNILTMSVGDGANWHTTQYTYDRYSRLLTQTDPLGQAESYTYDLNGNLTQKVDRNGVTTTNSYDAMGRLTKSQAGSDSLSFTYTKTGFKKTAAYNGQATTYTYNDAGDLLKEVTPVATKTMYYGIGGLRTALAVAVGDKNYLTSYYSYNKLGRLTQVESGNVEAHYSYDSNGNLTNVTNGNGTTASYTYNKADMVTEIKNKQNKLELSNFKYTYAADGNQLTKTDSRGLQTSYTYDGLNRLTQESQTGTAPFTSTYAYDPYGNRSQAVLAGVTTSYTYDANNRLLSTTGGEAGSYTYDSNGNLTQVTVGTGTAARTLNYTYDNFGRLKKVRDNTAETVYTYDADGLRLSKTTGGSTEQYVYDGDQLVVTIAPTPSLLFSGTIPASGTVDGSCGLRHNQRYYVEINGVVYPVTAELDIEVVSPAGGPGIIDGEDDGHPETPPVVDSDDPPAGFGTFVVIHLGDVTITSADGSPAGTVDGPAGTQVKLYTSDPRRVTTTYIRGLGLIASRTNQVPTYYHYDAHGNVVQRTSGGNALLKDYYYDAFGVEQTPDDTDPNIFRYCGEQYDAETGNYYLRARYYTPGVGRFTQEDPVRDGLNWYTYCGGNPVGFVDPSGLEWGALRDFVADLEETILPPDPVHETYVFSGSGADGKVTVQVGDGYARHTGTFYFDGRVQFPIRSGRSTRIVDGVAQNIDGHLYMERTDFYRAMGIDYVEITTKYAVTEDEQRVKELLLSAGIAYVTKDIRSGITAFIVSDSLNQFGMNLFKDVGYYKEHSIYAEIPEYANRRYATICTIDEYMWTSTPEQPGQWTRIHEPVTRFTGYFFESITKNPDLNSYAGR